MAALNVDPADSVFDVNGGGVNKHVLVNTTDQRHAFKVVAEQGFDFGD